MLQKGNIFGESFPEKIKNQIAVREYIYGQGVWDTDIEGRPTADIQFTGTRMEQLRYLHGNSSWIKLVSSVNIKSTGRFRNTPLENVKDISESNLARLNVLFAGTRVSGSDLRGGLELAGESFGRGRQENDDYGYPVFPEKNAYGFGGGESGLRPIPGITSATIEHLSNGTLRKATIKIKAYNRTQFEIIDTLYLRLGYSLLLEWGHTIMAQGTAPNKITYNTNPDTYSLENDFLEAAKDYQQILDTIRENREKSEGNYDGYLGRVVNFAWEFQPDGTYDITIFAISVGDVIESLNLNTTTQIDPSGSAQTATSGSTPYDVIGSYKNKHDLGNFLAEQAREVNTNVGFKELAGGLLDPNETGVYASYRYPFDTNATNAQSVTGLYRFEYYIRFGTLLRWLEQSKILTVGGNNPRPCLNIDYDLDTNLIQIDRFTAPCDPSVCIFQRKGYTLYKRPPKQIIGYKTAKKPIYEVIQDNATQADADRLQREEDANRTGTGPLPGLIKIFDDFGVTTYDTYVFDPTTKTVRVATGETRSERVPVYDDPKATLTAVDLFPKIAPEEYPRTQFFVDSTNLPNVGRLMNVFFNMTYLLKTFDSLIDGETGRVSLLDFLQTICEGFCSSTGGYNKLTVFIDEDTNTVKIIDKAGVSNKQAILNQVSGSTDYAIFNVYGFNPKITKANTGLDTIDYYTGNFIQNFQIRTELTKATSTMIAVSAAAQGQNILGENSTAFSVWNQGLEDRILKYFNNPTTTQDQQAARDKIITEKMKIFNAFIEALQGSTVFQQGQIRKHPLWNESQFSTYSNAAATLIKNNTNAEAIAKGTQNPGTGFLPLKVSLTMKGMSGMKILQEFEIRTDFLPSNYSDALRFLVMNIKHELSNNQWTTTLETISAPESSVIQKEEGGRRAVNTIVKAQTQGLTGCPTSPPSYPKPGILDIEKLEPKMLQGLNTSTQGNSTLRVLVGGIVKQEGGGNKGSSQFLKNNPGNLGGSNNVPFKYATMAQGWKAMIDTVVVPFVQGTSRKLKYLGATKLINCYITEDNNYFKNNNIPFTVQDSYSYQSGSPTLRQFFNQYTPLPGNCAQYIANMYKTLKNYGIGINSIDEPMSNYIKV